MNCPLLGQNGIPKEPVNLRFLYCWNCPLITNIPKELVKMEILDCYDCTNLTHIPNGLIKLKHLNCSDCPLLTHIPKELVNLKYLNCDNCPNLIDAPSHLLSDDLKLIFENNYLRYRKQQCSVLISIILEELIQRTWEPKRAMDWCWDEEEKKFMNDILH
jgi:hypothetical protein